MRPDDRLSSAPAGQAGQAPQAPQPSPHPPPLLSPQLSPPPPPPHPLNARGLVLEADSLSNSDVQSGYDYDLLTRSLTSSITNYPIENGRPYHKYHEGAYYAPNDERESDRLDMQYCILKHLFGDREYFAPLEKPARILDIGTGTGIWAIEMGEHFPDCQIEGTDLSPIQPSMVPMNVRFVIDDAAEEWVYPPNHFDYIHTRVLLGCFNDFRDIIHKGFKHCKPGGWMESQEIMTSISCDDGTMLPTWPFAEWAKLVDEAAMNIARPLRIANKLKRWYEEAGFVDVHEEVFKMPCNPWPKDPWYKFIGRLQELNLLDGIEAFSMALFNRGLNWSKTEVEVYLINVRKAIQERHVHAYHKVCVVVPSHPLPLPAKLTNRRYVVWGRKPAPK
ncbi:MAG: hypothetical protein M1829_006621 [Trizodia sp. TS-e1964]|nr:MAG: hypothetical protein M1829_006621 [Trizodia sp. TS-e1964]